MGSEKIVKQDLTQNHQAVQSTADIERLRYKAWTAVALAAELARKSIQNDNYQEVKGHSVTAILAAFDELGLLPAFPDMQLSLMAEGGCLNEKGEMEVISPKEEISSYRVKMVIVETLSPDTQMRE